MELQGGIQKQKTAANLPPAHSDLLEYDAQPIDKSDKKAVWGKLARMHTMIGTHLQPKLKDNMLKDKKRQSQISQEEMNGLKGIINHIGEEYQDNFDAKVSSFSI